MNQSVSLGDHDTMLSMIKSSYRTEAKKYLDWGRVEGYSLESFQAFVAWLEDSSYSVSTVNKHISAVKALVRRMVDSPDMTELQRYSLERSLDKIKHRKIGKGERAVRPDQILSDEELERFVARAPERTGLFVQFLVATGLRVSEACQVRLDRCKVDGPVAIRVVGKGSKERTVRVSRELFDRIRAAYSGSVWLFETSHGNPLDDRNVRDDQHRLGEKILGKHVHPHMLRHTFATRQIARTGKVQAVSEYLGHSSPAITMIFYVHESLDDGELFDA